MNEVENGLWWLTEAEKAERARLDRLQAREEVEYWADHPEELEAARDRARDANGENARRAANVSFPLNHGCPPPPGRPREMWLRVPE